MTDTFFPRSGPTGGNHHFLNFSPTLDQVPGAGPGWALIHQGQVMLQMASPGVGTHNDESRFRLGSL